MDPARRRVAIGELFDGRAAEDARTGGRVQDPKMVTGDPDLRRHEVGGGNRRQVEAMLLSVGLRPGGNVILPDAVRVLSRSLARCWRRNEAPGRRCLQWFHSASMVATGMVAGIS